MGIEDSQVDGPDRLPDIEHIGHDGIGQPDPEGIGCHAFHGADMLLGNIGDDTGGNGENDERHLFCNESDSPGRAGTQGHERTTGRRRFPPR